MIHSLLNQQDMAVCCCLGARNTKKLFHLLIFCRESLQVRSLWPSALTVNYIPVPSCLTPQSPAQILVSGPSGSKAWKELRMRATSLAQRWPKALLYHSGDFPLEQQANIQHLVKHSSVIFRTIKSYVLPSSHMHWGSTSQQGISNEPEE